MGISFLFFFFPYLKVTNTFVLPSWAEAWCKCDIMRFIRDWFIIQYFNLYCCYAFDLAIYKDIVDDNEDMDNISRRCGETAVIGVIAVVTAGVLLVVGTLLSTQNG